MNSTMNVDDGQALPDSRLASPEEPGLRVWWLPSAKIVTKVQLPYLYLRNLDKAPFGGRLRVGALEVSVSPTPSRRAGVR